MPTIRRCCIIGCNSNSREKPQLQFFQFPKPENPFHKLWKQACHASLSRILPFKKPVVCALHFHPKNIGGRRLTASAIPVLHLDVPSNLKAVEQQAMAAEIERSRKCAYINAVVYEWLVRANLNPNLRGSITHGMIKDKAETAKQIIDLDNFVADNRWLNRFRETHLTGFAAKLASNQLKPLGPSLWIPDIVKDLADLFPPTSADRMENVPEQYFSYMQQYGEYEEEDDKSMLLSFPQSRNSMNGSQMSGSYDARSDSNYSSPHHSSTSQSPPPMPHLMAHKRAKLDALAMSTPVAFSPTPSIKETSVNNEQVEDDDDDVEDDDDDDDEVQLITEPPVIQDLTTDDMDNDEPPSFTKTWPSTSASSSPNPNSNSRNSPALNNTNGLRYVLRLKGSTNGSSSGNNSPKQIQQTDSTNTQSIVNASTSSTANMADIKEIETYEDALKYLRPLEDFVLVKENFRAIGLLSQLEVILRRGVAARAAAAAQQ